MLPIPAVIFPPKAIHFLLFGLLLGPLKTTFSLKASDEEEKQPERQPNVSEFDIIDTNVDGLISYLEFQRWHRAALGAEPKNSATLFGTFDLDRDGKLTVAEFVPLAFEFSRKPEKEIEKVFKKFDQNSDGLLSQEELSEADGISEEIVAGLFEVADSNGDGRISRAEFGRVADTIESHISQEAKNLGQAQSLMAAFDFDGNGQITVDELSTYGRRYGAKGAAVEKEKAEGGLAEGAIRQLDRNKDGAISLMELKRLPEAVMNAAGIRPIIPA